jgi:hypothetical protein
MEKSADNYLLISVFLASVLFLFGPQIAQCSNANRLATPAQSSLLQLDELSEAK